MEKSVALQRYLQRHVEQGLPRTNACEGTWRQVLVIPVYRESVALLDTLQALPAGPGRSLVILVLNRPDQDTDESANAQLRSAVQSRLQQEAGGTPLLRLNEYSDLFLLDLETLQGATPASEGVGLARKAGCDLALQWMAQGVICGEWICCTDADARVPGDYFDKLARIDQASMAAVYPFRHVGGDSCARATALYELRLHHHVLGLEYATSPYAYHALGSCLAFRAEAYAQVRGFPKRAGAEDFYLLNKLNKLSPIARLSGAPVEIRSRLSTRVPFGTGPAVSAIQAEEQPELACVFYHPYCYEALRSVIQSVPHLAADPNQSFINALTGGGLTLSVARQTVNTLLGLGLQQALDHCRRQSNTPAQFLRHFHQWFDAFRQLKLLHALRDEGWPMQSLTQLAELEPVLWPTSDTDIEGLRRGVANLWGWGA